MNITDLTKGEYRKIYAGWIRGKRINSVAYEVEATFVRLNLIADSFGNFPADMDLLRAQAFVRRRSLEDDRIEGHLQELANAKLLLFYEVDGDRYGHIIGFWSLQPAGRNGKPFRRCPEPPFDDTQDNPDASKGIQTPKRTRTRKGTGTKKEQEQAPEGEENSTQGSPVPGPPEAWQKGKMQLDLALLPLIGLEEGHRHPPKSRKWNQDTTTKDNWFHDIIWPEGSDPDEAKARLAKLLKLIPKAAKNGKNPMAYLATVVGRKFKEAVA